MARKNRVLIMDDDKDLARIIGRILHRGGYEVFAAENGVEGLAKVDELKPDLVILDVMMPLLGGLAVCRRLRAKPATRHIPIIMLSALGQVDDKVNGFEAGADDYVSKPVEAKELLARAHALIQRSSMNRPNFAHTIALTGAKGGVGTTTVALNVAVALAKQEKSVVLAEMHTSGGNLRHHLKMKPSQQSAELLAMDPAQVRRPEIERRMVTHASTGLQLLLAPEGNTDLTLSELMMERIHDVIAEGVDYVLLDLPRLVGNGLRRAVELADQILLVTEPETLAIATGRAQIEQLHEWNMFDRTDVVAVSRTPSASWLNRIEMENRLGISGGEQQSTGRWDSRSALAVEAQDLRGVIAIVPPAPEMFHESVREGVPAMLMEPSSRPSRVLQDIADWIMDKNPSNQREVAPEAAPIKYIT